MRVLLHGFCLVSLIASAQAQTTGANPPLEDMIRDLSPTTRGILPMSPQAAAPAERPSVKLWVDFVTGSAALSPHAVQQLGVLGQALTSPSLVRSRFRIEGHTDTVGTPEQNRDLSTRRAQTVSHYLSDSFHIDPSRLAPVGVGSDNLLVQTPDQTPEARNRRVRIVNLGS